MTPEQQSAVNALLKKHDGEIEQMCKEHKLTFCAGYVFASEEKNTVRVLAECERWQIITCANAMANAAK